MDRHGGLRDRLREHERGDGRRDSGQAQAAATRLWLNFGGEELGIAAIESLAEKQSLYDLQGQKIGQPRKGEIYIKGGRKAVIR